MSRPQDDRNQEATVYLVSQIDSSLRCVLRKPQGNLDERCTDALVWELMLQAGPVGQRHLPFTQSTLYSRPS